MFSLLKKKLSLIVLYLLVACSWGWAYVSVIVPVFGYEGYYLSCSSMRILFSIFIIISIVSLLPVSVKKFSDFYIHLQFLFPILPMIILYSLSDFSSLYLVYSIVSFLILVALTRVRFIRIWSIFVTLASGRYLFALCMIICLLTMVLIAFKFKGHFNLDISKVYFYRSFFISKLSFAEKYIYNVVLKSILGFLIGYSLVYRKSLVYFILFTLISILAFGFTTMKVFLFQPVFMLFLFVVLRKKNPLNLFLKLTVLGSIFLVIYSLYSEDIILASLFIRRLVYVPAMLNYQYFNFFSLNPKVFWSDSFWLPIRFFYEYPYNLPLSHVIGEAYLGNPNCGANTGWIGSGYAHAGFLGMLIYAVILSWIFKFIDRMESRWNRNFLIITFFPVAIALLFSSDLKSCILTHGLLVYILLLYFGRGEFKGIRSRSYYTFKK